MTRALISIPIILFSLQLSAQTDAPMEVNTVPPVTIADFAPVSPLVNSETDAVILLDSGASTIDSNPQDGFFLTYYHFRRILILNKNCLSDIAKFTISYSVKMNGDILKTVRAFTYNLGNGKISKLASQDKDYYTENSKNNIRDLKFAFPNVREGSIIEFEYSKKMYSPELRNWDFQGTYPRLRSVYTVKVPDGFNFSIQCQNKKYLSNTRTETVLKTFYAWTNFEDTKVHNISWIFENVPPMRTEVYTSTIENYVACVKFQISAIPTQPGISKGVYNDWPWYSKILLQAGNFGKAISDPSTTIKKQARIFAGEDNSELQKAMGIYANLRDHFKVTGQGIYMTEDQNLTGIYNAGLGSVADINLVLIAMLRSQKIQSDPVILATRDRGLTNQQYPILDNYNYLICRSIINGKEYFLDASSPFMAFGKLPAECYNGHARVITKETFPVYLAPDSLKESRSVVANICNGNHSQNLVLEYLKHDGFYESCDLRTELKDKKTELIFSSMTETVPFKKSLDSFSIRNRDSIEAPLTLYYKMSLDPGNSSRIYFNPFLNYGLSENPFKSAQRSYPVEMPYVPDDSYVLNMEVPAGYEIEELPTSQKFLLNESDGSFEYKITVNGNKIEVKSIMILKKAIFEPEDYDNLKNFYSVIIRKQHEMIVFKRKV